MLKLIRTNSQHPDFIALVKLLDADLAIRDGDEHAFYDQFNKIDAIKHTIVAYQNELPVACGAIKEYDSRSMEVKRMYTLPDYRGKGIASKILQELENWATQLSYKRCILETGKKQPEAIAVYRKNGYEQIPNYEPYADADNSLCFEKIVTK